MAQMTMHEIDAAALRCTRLAVGVRETELEQILGVDAGTVAAWEERRAPLDEDAIGVLADITAAAAAQTVLLVEQAAETGQILTFTEDLDTVAATGDRLQLASVHRVCAGRAAIAVPSASVTLRDAAGEDRDGWTMCVAIACGLGHSQMHKWFDVPRRVAQRWLVGERPVPEGVANELAAIAAAARTHVDDLTAQIDPEDPVVWVCATEEQMEQTWPEHTDLPLTTHQICAARAAAGVDGARLVYLPG